MLINLFENSLQQGSDSVKISSHVQENRLHLRVHDNGSGVSEANRNKIFTPFFTTRRDLGGTGLGLESALSLLKAYGGTIELFDSEKGALFVITLQFKLNN